MAGLTACHSGEQGVILVLVAGAEIGIIGRVASDAGAALSAVDGLIGRFQRA